MLDLEVDLDRKVPVAFDDRRVGQAEALARGEIEILERVLRLDAEAADHLAPEDEERVLDDRPVMRMADDLGAVALLDHRALPQWS